MPSRGLFKSKIGFIASAAGAAVGLGNIWKFPFEVEDGGGAAFVLVYLVCCLLIGFPLMVTCIALGRKGNSNVVQVFDNLGFRRWNFMGKLMAIDNIIILSIYLVVAAWSFGYFIEMVKGNFEIGKQFGIYSADIKTVTIYWIVFIAVTAFIVSKGVSKGIERAAKILMPTLLIILIILAVYVQTIPHSGTGISYYLLPDFSKLSMRVIFSAVGQAFFSLSICGGIIITYGSYLSKDDNIISSAAFVTIADVAVALLAGFMIFPLVAFLTSGSMEGIEGGSGLIFVTMPEAFGLIGFLGSAVGSLFFLLLSFAALTTTVAIMEVPVAYIIERFNKSRSYAVVLLIAITLVLSMPSIVANGYSDYFKNFIRYPGSEASTDFMTFVGQIVDSYLQLSGILIVLFLIFKWKISSLDLEITRGNPGYIGSATQKFINVVLKYVAPVVLTMLFILGFLSTFFGISVL